MKFPIHLVRRLVLMIGGEAMQSGFHFALNIALLHMLSAQSPRIIQAARMYLILMPIYALVGLPYQLLRGVQHYRLWNVMRLVPAFLWLGVLIVGTVALGIARR